MDVRLERRIGEDIAPVIPDLARLRISVFREWPYLYAGDEAFERNYLSAYIGSPRALAVLAWQGVHIIGAGTGMPMADEVDEIRQPIEQAGRDPREIFYFGESVLLPGFRGQGIGVRFFAEREEHARGLGYRYAMFCAVERSPVDPRAPSGHVPLDAFWQKRGYRQTDITTTFSWKEVGEGVETPKSMHFWIKDLRDANLAP